MSEATKAEAEPTVNAKQDAEIAALKAEVKELTAKLDKATKAMAASGKAEAPKRKLGATSAAEARKRVQAAFNKTPKTYRALQNGTDFSQGFIPEGTIFTTTQPQGSWMELIDDAEAADAE